MLKINGVEYGPENPLVMVGAGINKHLGGEPFTGLGAADFVVAGSFTPLPRDANPGGPHEFFDDGLFSVNAWGMNNQGREIVAVLLGTDPALQPVREKLICSVAGFSAEDYVKMYESLAGLTTDIELNFGCPNASHKLASFDPQYLYDILDALHFVAARNPTLVGVKLSPYTDLSQLAEVAAVINSFEFIDYVACTNTIPNVWGYRNGVTHAIHTSANGPKGGGGGRALKPLSHMNAAEFVERLDGSKSVVRVGGVEDGNDLYQTYDVGAAGVQMVTAIAQKGVRVLTAIKQEYADVVG